jgi:hypothetical protein
MSDASDLDAQIAKAAARSRAAEEEHGDYYEALDQHRRVPEAQRDEDWRLRESELQASEQWALGEVSIAHAEESELDGVRRRRAIPGPISAEAEAAVDAAAAAPTVRSSSPTVRSSSPTVRSSSPIARWGLVALIAVIVIGALLSAFPSGGGADDTTVAASTTTTVPASTTPPTDATTMPATLPTVTRFVVTFDPATFTTTYRAEVTGFARPPTFSWYLRHEAGEEDCGVFKYSGNTATWTHPHQDQADQVSEFPKDRLCKTSAQSAGGHRGEIEMNAKDDSVHCVAVYPKGSNAGDMSDLRPFECAPTV